MLRPVLEAFPNKGSPRRIEFGSTWPRSGTRWQANSISSTAHSAAGAAVAPPSSSSQQGGVLDSHEDIIAPSRSAVIRRFRSLVPLCHFSSSVYNVPALLFFRLFYQAAPFEINLPVLAGYSRNADLPVRKAKLPQRHAECPAAEAFFSTYATTDTTQFCSLVKENPQLREVKLKSMTWVKALASPLSHEYLQFIVENDSGTRHRLIADRSERGDLVTVGWDWRSGEYASHNHVLPLPLLTLSFDLCSSPPTLCDFAQILSETSATQEYRLFREMCWWFSEKVFVRAAQEFHGARLKQWPHASLRYSFVVRTEWIKRLELVRAAEHFRKQNLGELRY